MARRQVISARALVALQALALSCGRATPQPPAPAESTSGAAAVEATSPDVAFLQGMIAHHAQAMYMSRLAPARSRAADVRTLAERIEVSQREEIALMSRWLIGRGQRVPDTTHVAQGHDVPAHRMPGMLTGDELRALAAATGETFDQRFLALMIRHHEGALAMVAELRSRPGAAQDPALWRFASDVDADQRAEIARMRRMLAARGSPDGAP